MSKDKKKNSVEESIITTRALTNFSPSKKQIAFVKSFLTADVSASMKDISENAGISTKVIYLWKKRPEFNAWFHSLTVDYMKSNLPSIYRILTKRSTDSDKALKMYLERFDDDFIDRKVVDGSFNVSVKKELGEITDEELEKILGERGGGQTEGRSSERGEDENT